MPEQKEIHVADIATYPFALNLIVGLGRWSGFHVEFNRKMGIRFVLGFLTLSLYTHDVEMMTADTVMLNRQLLARTAWCPHCHKKI